MVITWLFCQRNFWAIFKDIHTATPAWMPIYFLANLGEKDTVIDCQTWPHQIKKKKTKKKIFESVLCNRENKSQKMINTIMYHDCQFFKKMFL